MPEGLPEKKQIKQISLPFLTAYSGHDTLMPNQEMPTEITVMIATAHFGGCDCSQTNKASCVPHFLSIPLVPYNLAHQMERFLNPRIIALDVCVL